MGRRWFSLIAAVCAAGLIAVWWVSTPVGAASLPSTAPTVTALEASPTTAFGYLGGPVTMSASVAHTTTCTFSANVSLAGLPTKKACTNGPVSDSVKLPANPGQSAMAYTLTLTVNGGAGTKAAITKRAVTVREREQLPDPRPRCQPDWV